MRNITRALSSVSSSSFRSFISSVILPSSLRGDCGPIVVELPWATSGYLSSWSLPREAIHHCVHVWNRPSPSRARSQSEIAEPGVLNFNSCMEGQRKFKNMHEWQGPSELHYVLPETWSRHSIMSIAKTSVFVIEIFNKRLTRCHMASENFDAELLLNIQVFYLTSYVSDMNYITDVFEYTFINRSIWYLPRILIFFVRAASTDFHHACMQIFPQRAIITA